MVAYSGWNAATYVGEEMRRPERKLPASLASGTAIVTLAYLGLNLLLFTPRRSEQMKNVVAVGSLAAAQSVRVWRRRGVLRADGRFHSCPP